jgi:sulfite reductase alpha subunit-like flavoprotein
MLRAGDHVAVFAENSPAVVQAAAAALGLPLDHCFRLRVPSSNKHSLPEPPAAGPMTLRCALARYADLLSAPNKAALMALGACAADPEEADRLQRLASIEGAGAALVASARSNAQRVKQATAGSFGRRSMLLGTLLGAPALTRVCTALLSPLIPGKSEYHSYVVAAKRSLLEVLQDFPSARPSLGAPPHPGLPYPLTAPACTGTPAATQRRFYCLQARSLAA